MLCLIFMPLNLLFLLSQVFFPFLSIHSCSFFKTDLKDGWPPFQVDPALIFFSVPSYLTFTFIIAPPIVLLLFISMFIFSTRP